MELFGKIHSTENMLRGKMGKIECWALLHSLGKSQRRFSEDQMLGILLQCVTCLAPPPSSQFNDTIQCNRQENMPRPKTGGISLDHLPSSTEKKTM